MDGEKEELEVEVADATSVVAKDATESIGSESIKLQSLESHEPSADSVPLINSYQIKPDLRDK